jgi:hypothetical protein
MSEQTPCKIQSTLSGWYLTFSDPKAGLLLDTNEEKLQLLIDCGIRVTEPDLDRLLDRIQITECPIEYYQRGCKFSPCPF